MRLIDAEALEEQINERLRCCNKGSIVEACLMADIDLIKHAATITPPPNDPLTLDELRELGGQPVWISPVRDKRKIPERWMLMSGFLREDRVFLFMPPGGMVQGYPASTYGRTWLAYLRKPEKKAPREGGTA